MLGSLVEDRVFGEVDGALVITPQSRGLLRIPELSHEYEACKEGIVGGIKEITMIGMSWEDSGYPCSLNLMLCK
ncbi:hypothetical protein CLOM_g19760 [Closterium sp. NIES-68]|nr:hypothetical protein CLOM_g19759 [Closterium sp. NIES-68]GJP35264.1 hypothetical protein CLOM_g19760 [Closterium sp. NIES-68]